MATTKKIATKKKPRGKPFKAGNQAAAVKGKGKGKLFYDREELLAKKIDNVTVTNYITLNSHLTPEQLIHRLKNEKVSVLEGMVIKIMLKGYRTGDIYQANFILERLVGKVPNVIDHNINNPFKDMSDEELMQEKIRLSESNRKTMNFLEQNNERLIQQEKLAHEFESTTTGEPDTND